MPSVVLCLVAQLCPALCNPMYCSLPGSPVHGDSPGKNTGVGCHALLQGIFPTQGLNPGLPHCRWILYCLSHQGSPRILEWVAYPFSGGSSGPRNQTRISCTAGRFFTSYHGIAMEVGIKAEEKVRDPEARPPPNLPSATGHPVLNTYTQAGSQLFCRSRGTDVASAPQPARRPGSIPPMPHRDDTGISPPVSPEVSALINSFSEARITHTSKYSVNTCSKPSADHTLYWE